MTLAMLAPLLIMLWASWCLILRRFEDGCTCQPPPKLQFRSEVSVRWYLWLVCMFLFPIGEATNPGPCGSRGDEFSLGCCNTSGLVGKAHIFHQNMDHGDLWLASETHPSHTAMQRFRSGLAQVRSPFKFCVGGHPVPLRGDRTITGIWRGVAAISKFPTRGVPHQWDAELHRSCRLGIFASLIND